MSELQELPDLCVTSLFDAFEFAGITQTKLAEEWGVSRAVVNRMRVHTKRPRYHSVRRAYNTGLRLLGHEAVRLCIREPRL